MELEQKVPQIVGYIKKYVKYLRLGQKVGSRKKIQQILESRTKSMTETSNFCKKYNLHFETLLNILLSTEYLILLYYWLSLNTLKECINMLNIWIKISAKLNIRFWTTFETKYCMKVQYKRQWVSNNLVLSLIKDCIKVHLWE